MEIEDCGFKTLDKIDIYDNTDAGFNGINWALLVGSKPRGPGMERNDLIRDNGHIFVGQGKSLNKAASDVRSVSTLKVAPPGSGVMLFVSKRTVVKSPV